MQEYNGLVQKNNENSNLVQEYNDLVQKNNKLEADVETLLTPWENKAMAEELERSFDFGFFCGGVSEREGMKSDPEWDEKV